MEKILAEATSQVSDKDEQKEASTANKEGIDDTSPRLEEEGPPQGAEPMEEGGGTIESQPSSSEPDPEVEMNQETLTHTEPEKANNH